MALLLCGFVTSVLMYGFDAMIFFVLGFDFGLFCFVGFVCSAVCVLDVCFCRVAYYGYCLGRFAVLLVNALCCWFYVI